MIRQPPRYTLTTTLFPYTTRFRSWRKSSGTAAVWGHDIDSDTRRARAAIGVVPQDLNLDPFFTPREALEFQAGLYGVPKSERRTDEILAAVGLTDKANSSARTLSGGMRRRMLVATAPEIGSAHVCTPVTHAQHVCR